MTSPDPEAMRRAAEEFNRVMQSASAGIIQAFARVGEALRPAFLAMRELAATHALIDRRVSKAERNELDLDQD